MPIEINLVKLSKYNLQCTVYAHYLEMPCVIKLSLQFPETIIFLHDKDLHLPKKGTLVQHLQSLVERDLV